MPSRNSIEATAERHDTENFEDESDGNAGFLRAARDGNLNEVLDYLKGSTDINTSNPNGLNALHLASKEGHVKIVTELLSRGANVEAATKKGNTSLHIAALAGHEEIVNILVENNAKVNVQAQAGFTPLYMAAQEGHSEVVRFLLANGASQSLATEDGFTPLAVALQQGHEKVVGVLLEHDTKGKVHLPALHIAAKKDDVKSAALLLQNEQNNVDTQTKNGGLVNDTTKSGFTPLHIASHYGNTNVANLLIQRGADVNFKAKNNITPLHVGSRWGKSNMVALLLDNNADITERTRDGLTPLHCAARSGHEGVVDLLLERVAPHSSKTKNGLTPLHMAAQGDHVDCARLLLYHKAQVDDVTVDYLTPLHVAAHCGNVKTAKLLLDRKCEPNSRALNGFTPLHIACKKNRIKVVELLLKYGANIEATTESGLTPLHVASFMGHMNIVIYLIQQNANPDFKTVRGETSLHLAARANQTDIIRILLRNGATVDAKAREQQTPLHIASRLGNVDNVVLLLQHGASPDATTKDLYTPLHIAAKEGHDECAQVLLEQGADHSMTTKKGFTPLHIAAKYGNIKVARLLLQKDANPDVQGKNGLTPLHVATHYNHVNVAQLLLENKASPHSAAKNGYTPLHIAAKKNQMDIATTLLEYGAKPNAESKNGFTPLHLAAQEGHTDMVSLLLEQKANVNAKANNGLTPMHLAAQEDKVNVAQVLVKYDSEIDPNTKAGYTPLHTACHFGQINMTRFLLEHQASVNATTKVGYTPLHQAAQQGHVMVVNMLLKNQASPNAITNNGQTPLAIAQKLGYISVVDTLKGVTEVTDTMPMSEEKYKVVSPETMQETLISDSEDEGGDDFLPQSPIFGKPLSEQHIYLPYYEGQKMQTRDDSLSFDRGGSTSPLDNSFDKDYMEAQITSQTYASQKPDKRLLGSAAAAPGQAARFSSYSGSSFSTTFDPDNVTVDRAPVYTGKLKWKSFLISFMVDARGGAMRGCRHSGIRVIIPPRKASMPTRVTCRLVKKERLSFPPPLIEGEGLAARVIEMGPVGTKFLGPIIIEVPHFASLRGKEREVQIIRSDDGQNWYEHPMVATEEAVNDALGGSLEGLSTQSIASSSISSLWKLDQEDDLATKRITRILTTDFPQYFALISRIRQENQNIGEEGNLISSTVVPQVQAVFPEGVLTKKIRVGLQAQPIAPELVAKLLGNRVAVSPIVTVEPRRRKFHKPITLTIPVPVASQKGMINQYGGERPTLRLLYSISEGKDPAVWEDITENKPMTLVNDCVSFTTTVSARFWLIDCQNVNEATQMATALYREAITVPYMAKFVVFAKRTSTEEGKLRMFCMTDDKIDKTLEKQERFTEVARSRDIEVLEGRPQYIEMAGNLIPVTKSGDQLHVNFKAFRENRLPCIVKIRDLDQEPAARVAFMKEPKVGRGEAPQMPICNLNISLGDAIKSDSMELNSSTSALDSNQRRQLLRETGIVVQDTVKRGQMKLNDIADHVRGDWVILAQQLGIRMTDINSIKNEYNNVNDQALAMLQLWVDRDKEQATGNQLENALRSINREDVIRSCMYDIETVDDEVEAAVARAAMDQSGFDTFKEEIGIAKDSMRRGMSLDVQYDEQDMIKESESANESSPGSEKGSLIVHTDKVAPQAIAEEASSYRPSSVSEDFTVEVDSRRPVVKVTTPEERSLISERKTEAYINLISELDKFEDERERRQAEKVADEGIEDQESVVEEEINRTSREEFDYYKKTQSSTSQAVPSSGRLPSEGEVVDDELVKTPPPSPTEQTSREEEKMTPGANVVEAAARLATVQHQDEHGTDYMRETDRASDYRHPEQSIQARSSMETESARLAYKQDVLEQMTSPTSDGSYPEEPSSVPEPTMPADFRVHGDYDSPTDGRGYDDFRTHQTSYDQYRGTDIDDYSKTVEYSDSSVDRPIDNQYYDQDRHGQIDYERHEGTDIDHIDQYDNQVTDRMAQYGTDMDSYDRQYIHEDEDGLTVGSTEEVFDANVNGNTTEYHETLPDGTVVKHKTIRSLTGSGPNEIEVRETESPIKEVKEVSETENILPDGTVHKKQLVRRHSIKKITRSVTIDEGDEEITQEVVNIPDSDVTDVKDVEESEQVLPDGTVKKKQLVRRHSLRNITRSVTSEDGDEDLTQEQIKIPGSERTDIIETFASPAELVTQKDQVEEVLPCGDRVTKGIIVTKMVHKLKTHHVSFDADSDKIDEQVYEHEEIVPGTVSTFLDDSSSESSFDDDEESIEISDREETLEDGTVHHVHKVSHHFHKHTSAGDPVVDSDRDDEAVDVIETFEQPVHTEGEIVELPGGDKNKQTVAMTRQVHKLKTHEESMDYEGHGQSGEYEIEEVIPGTVSAFVAGQDSDTEDDILDELKADITQVDDVLDDGSVTSSRLTTSSEKRTVRSRSGSIDECYREQVVAETLEPKEGSEERHITHSTYSSTHIEESYSAVGSADGSAVDLQEDCRELEETGLNKRTVSKVTYTPSTPAVDRGQIYEEGDESDPDEPDLYATAAGAEGDPSTRLLMKKEIHSRTVIGRFGQEETFVLEDSQVQQDQNPPEELKESMQHIISQFMETKPEMEEIEEPKYLEDDV